MQDSPEHLYLEIAESIRRRIASGELAPADRLPSVRALARVWSCTPGTVGRAYSVLSDEGLVVSHRGRGTHVAPSVLQPGRRDDRQSGDRSLRWATLINRAEQYVLEAASNGYSANEAQAALSVAITRWRALRDAGAASGGALDRPAATLRFSGSHDLLVQSIASQLEASEPGLRFELNFSGSLGGLLSLLRGEADVAGIHLWDEETDTYNVPYVRRLFPGGQAALTTLAHRDLGLIVDAKRTAGVDSLAILTQEGLRFVNRQRGSGTRMWLDAQLRRLNIDGADIKGYDVEVATHMAVAKRVASQEADAGLGIYAAAAALELGFVPLTKERYDLVYLKPALEEPTPLKLLVETVRTKAAQLLNTIEALGGYDASETGREWILPEVER